MKIYTKTGDKGKTGLIGGRLDKDHPRVEAYGTIDELNSWIGLTISQLNDRQDADLVNVLGDIQQQLFDCCSDLVTLNTLRREYRITPKTVQDLENLIDQYNQEADEIDRFIIPGGTQPAAMLHVGRTVARRAERRVVTLLRQAEPVNPDVLPYLNRLSDLLFVLARVCNARAGEPDIFYTRSKKVFRKKKHTLSKEESKLSWEETSPQI